MTGASPLSRVTLDGRPWVRMDGLVLFPGDPSGYPLLPVLYDASGALVRIGATASVGSNGPGVSQCDAMEYRFYCLED